MLKARGSSPNATHTKKKEGEKGQSGFPWLFLHVLLYFIMTWGGRNQHPVITVPGPDSGEQSEHVQLGLAANQEEFAEGLRWLWAQCPIHFPAGR